MSKSKHLSKGEILESHLNAKYLYIIYLKNNEKMNGALDTITEDILSIINDDYDGIKEMRYIPYAIAFSPIVKDEFLSFRKKEKFHVRKISLDGVDENTRKHISNELHYLQISPVSIFTADTKTGEYTIFDELYITNLEDDWINQYLESSENSMSETVDQYETTINAFLNSINRSTLQYFIDSNFTSLVSYTHELSTGNIVYGVEATVDGIDELAILVKDFYQIIDFKKLFRR